MADSQARQGAEMEEICEQLIVRMGADPSNAPRARVAVEFHQV
jgi:hypothetical protein